MTVFSREKPLAAVRWVRVGSLNEPKLAAVRSAIGAYAPDVEIEGVAVASGVPEQPVCFEEVILGARNRAAGARSGSPCDLGIGIEDGLVPLPTGSSEGAVARTANDFFETHRLLGHAARNHDTLDFGVMRVGADCAANRGQLRLIDRTDPHPPNVRQRLPPREARHRVEASATRMRSASACPRAASTSRA